MSLPRLILLPLVLASSVWLHGCGGGAPSAPGDGFVAQLSAARAGGQVGTGSLGTPAPGVSASAIVKPTITVEQLFDWAEDRYGSLFPKGPKTLSVQVDGANFLVRHYGTTGNYLGVAPDGMVYGLGPATQGVLLQLGRIESYICLVLPDNCGSSEQ